MGRTSHPEQRSTLSAALKALGGQSSTPDLVRILQHPFAAGPEQRALLDVLGERTRRQFHNTWEFLDWAQSNGVDLTSPDR